MKYKLIITTLIIAFLVGLFGILQYKKYLDFLELYNSQEYTSILENTESNSAEMLHNYGLSAFESFQNTDMADPKLLLDANLFFSGSLQKGEHIKTRYQYELTKSILELYKQQEEKDKQQESDENQNGEESGGESQNESEGEGGEEENNQSQSKNNRDSEYFLGQEQEIKPLSEREKLDIEKSIEKLKSDQMRNQQYYGKQQQLSPFQDAFDNIFGTVDRGGEKDW